MGNPQPSPKAQEFIVLSMDAVHRLNGSGFKKNFYHSFNFYYFEEYIGEY